MCSPNFRGTKWVWTIAKGQLSMPRWKGQKWIQNDTEQTEQTNRPSFWDANCRAGSSDHGQCNRRVTSPTWEPPRWSHQSISLSVAPGLSPKIVGAKRSVTETMLQGHMTHNWHFLQWRSSNSWLSWRSKVCSASFWLTKVITGYSDQPFQIQKRVKYLVLMQTWCEVDTSIAEAVNKHQISSDQNPDDRHASTKICLTPSWKPRSVGAAWIQHLQTSRKFVDSPGTGDGSTCNASKSLGEARHSHRWRVCV